MIIWLNGPFGIGKTTVAQALVQRLPDGLLYDPELIGEMLQRIVGAIDPVSDFQDLRAWRELVADGACQFIGRPAEFQPGICLFDFLGYDQLRRRA